MRSQLEIRDCQIYELKRLYKEARDAEMRNAEVVQRLRVELSGVEAPGSKLRSAAITGNQQNRELHDRITQLQTQLRSAMCWLFIINDWLINQLIGCFINYSTSRSVDMSLV